FQYPEEIPGVPVAQFLRQALSARRGTDLSVLELRVSIMEWMKRLGMDPSFGDRYLNEGFSGGEKKRNEILQLAVLEPDLAILDQQVPDRRLVYLDSASSAQKPVAVIEAMTHYYETTHANVHRGVYAIAEEATRLFEAGRSALARFIGAPAGEVVFTKNVTEA